MKNIWVSCVGVFASAMLAACGGSSRTCGNTAGCGGDIVGTWKTSSSCVTVNLSMFDGTCPSASVNSVNVDIKGSMTFNADKTYTSTATLTGTVTVVLPAACLTSGGITTTCAQLNQMFAAEPSTAGVTCVGTSSCTCTGPLSDGTATNETGTYSTTAAGVLTQTAAGQSPEDSAYCVKGTTLTLSPTAMSSMMGQESGTITLTKQ